MRSFKASREDAETIRKAPDAGMVAIADPNPGTPDSDVSVARRAGRLAFHTNCDPDDYVLQVAKSKRVEWWLGWYDERLRRFYGR